MGGGYTGQTSRTERVFLQFLVTQDVPDKKIASLKQIQLLTKIVASMCTFWR